MLQNREVVECSCSLLTFLVPKLLEILSHSTS